MNAGDDQSKELSDLPTGRRTVEDLLLTSAAEAIPASMVMVIDVGWAENLRKHYSGENKITITAILLKAIALAQRHHPATRTEVLPLGDTVTYDDIVAGFTVEREVDGEPTVFFGEIVSPETKSIEEIAHELRECGYEPIQLNPSFALQAGFATMPAVIRRLILKLGRNFPAFRLKAQKSTFGVTTLGKYGVSLIVCPCICTSTFGIGAIEDSVVVRGHKVDVKTTLPITFNYDQRVLNHIEAASFFREVCQLLEGGLRVWLKPELPRPLRPDRGDNLRKSA